MRNKLNWASPDLQNLVDLFFDDPESLGHFTEVSPESLPAYYRRLLAHPHHMTVANEEFHHSPVTVEVVAEHRTDSHYSRQSLLRRTCDQQVVQCGIMRISRQQLPASVMEQIERKDLPLGRVLIENEILRHVKVLSLWHVSAGRQLREHFGAPSLESCFGRTAILYLNGLPVVELLEIVRV